MKKNPKRDFVIIVLIVAMSLLGYYIYNIATSKANAYMAEVIYDGKVLVVVDFEKREVITKKQQPEITLEYTKAYPIINLENNTITLLGDYEINKVRQEVVITYDFNKRSMKIVEEESPNNVCSKLGESTNKPLICIPNNIIVKFITKANEDIDWEI